MPDDPTPTGWVRAILGDARELPGIAPSSIALVVTSPPYPMVAQWDGLFHRWGAEGFDGMHARLAEVWRACRDALLPGGLLAINVGDALRTVDGEFRLWPNHVRVTLACEALGLRPLPYVLWKKPTNRPNAYLGSGFLPPNAYVTIDCEFILLFRKGPLRAFPRGDKRRPASRYSRVERDAWFSQVWEGIRGVRQGAVGRRTGAFPSEIPERLVRMFSVVGDTVLDPFAGTGTTLWAAARLGRNAIGVEIDPAIHAALLARIGSAERPSD
ncbi:MAG TPA: site-specific DNA-methyltransferase [Thermoplasmata archaeon]|nr:site-specific DNA-methyltransferase [Thermoplasmata archaeon]HEV2428282.1 site-specific DNA-methyltransferase [Thermoplasmata archaeon]